MMQIGVIDANDMLIEAELDGVVFHLGLSWNQEGQLWTLSIRDLNKEILTAGIGIVPNWPLLRQIRQANFPVGELAVDAPAGIHLNRNSFSDGTAALIYFSSEDFNYVAPPKPKVAAVLPYSYNPFAGPIVTPESPIVTQPPVDPPPPPPPPDPPTDPNQPPTGPNQPPTNTPAVGTPYFTITSANSKCVINSQSWPSAEITVSLPIELHALLFTPAFVANGSGKTAERFFFSNQADYWSFNNGQTRVSRALTTADINAYDMNLHWLLTDGALITVALRVRVVSATGSTVPVPPGGAPFLQVQHSNTYVAIDGQTGTVANVRFIRPVYGGKFLLSVVPKNTTATGNNLFYSSDLGFLGVTNGLITVSRDLLSTDDGIYTTTVFRNMSDGTLLQLTLNIIIAADLTTANPVPTPAPTTPQIFFESFDYNRNTGALVKGYLYENMINTPKGTLLIDGADASAMTMVHPEKTNDGTYGFGNGLYEIRARIIGNARGSGAGPALILWPADDVWPGSEIDFVEINPLGQAYGAMHRKNPTTGLDQNITFVYTGLNYNEFNTYYVRLKTTETSLGVNGVQYGVSSTYAAPDFANGGTNHAIGVANQGTTTGIEVDWIRFTPEALLPSDPPPNPDPDQSLYITLDDGTFLTDDSGAKIEI